MRNKIQLSFPHLLQALALAQWSKVVGRPEIVSYQTLSPDPTSQVKLINQVTAIVSKQDS